MLGGGVARVQLPSSTLFCLELEDSFEVARDGGSEGMYQDMGEFGPDLESTLLVSCLSFLSATSLKLVVILVAGSWAGAGSLV